MVLVTGVSRFLGARVADTLQADPSIERVIGVDTVAPTMPLGRTEFVRIDIRTPSIAKIINAAEVDTVVHLNLVTMTSAARMKAKELNVIGTMQLLAACQRSAAMRKVVVRSSAAVYGSSGHDPAVFAETDEPVLPPSSGYAKDAVEVEGYVRGLARRRSDLTVSVLRFANFLGPHVDSPLSRYFHMPVVATVLGFDPRLQFIHEDDGVEVLRRMAVEDHPGTFNVAGDGVVLLSQALRRGGRPILRMPAPALQTLGDVGPPLRRAEGLLARAAPLADVRPGARHRTARPRAVLASEIQLRGSLRRFRRFARSRSGSAACPLRQVDQRRRGQKVSHDPVEEARPKMRPEAQVIPLNLDAADHLAQGPGGLEHKLASAMRFVRRRMAGDYQVDEFGFDPELNEGLLLPRLRPLYERWFRVEMIGLDNVPDTGPALVVGNHSGTLPIDGVMLQVGLHDDHPARRNLRLLGADLVYQMPVLAHLARKSGHTLACQADAARLLSRTSSSGSSPRASRASASRSPSATSFSGSAAAASWPPRCARRCRSSRARSSGPRRSIRSSPTSSRWPGCSASPTSR